MQERKKERREKELIGMSGRDQEERARRMASVTNLGEWKREGVGKKTRQSREQARRRSPGKHKPAWLTGWPLPEAATHNTCCLIRGVYRERRQAKEGGGGGVGGGSLCVKGWEKAWVSVQVSRTRSVRQEQQSRLFYYYEYYEIFRWSHLSSVTCWSYIKDIDARVLEVIL